MEKDFREEVEEIISTTIGSQETIKKIRKDPVTRTLYHMLIECTIRNRELEEQLKKPKKRKCRECGCTDEDCSQCVREQGRPCHWVDIDLCSRCAKKLQDQAEAEEIESLNRH